MPAKLKENSGNTYLSSDLVSALAGLEMHDFPHIWLLKNTLFVINNLTHYTRLSHYTTRRFDQWLGPVGIFEACFASALRTDRGLWLVDRDSMLPTSWHARRLSIQIWSHPTLLCMDIAAIVLMVFFGNVSFLFDKVWWYQKGCMFFKLYFYVQFFLVLFDMNACWGVIMRIVYGNGIILYN